jgi:cytochrome c oxidase assembly protein subunit 15
MTTGARDSDGSAAVVQVGGAVGRERGLIGPALVYGFGTSVAVWCAWYVTHLPWLALHEQVSLPMLLGVWLLGMVAAGRGAPRGRALPVGLVSGLVTALVGIPPLLTKLMEQAPQGDASAGMRPNGIVLILGFLVTGMAIGGIGALIGGLIRRETPPRDWLSRFALVAAAAVVPLIIAGGLVTSTNSGMAVPDWPNTYGSNMFLYPLGPRARPDVYLEHAHRLFGTLVGLTTMVLMVWVLARRSARWLAVLAVLAFVLVASQGLLGGVRVREGAVANDKLPRLLAMTHGIAAQLIFGLIVALAAGLSPRFRSAPPSDIQPIPAPQAWRKARFFTTGLLHATILQLLFGAMYRHFRDNHSLWTHAGFSVVVLMFALAAGFSLMALEGGPTAVTPVLKRLGRLLMAVVNLQFLLGWATFGFGRGAERAAEGGVAVLRTVHQANGALTLAAAVLGFMWMRKALRLARAGGAMPSAPAPAPA